MFFTARLWKRKCHTYGQLDTLICKTPLGIYGTQLKPSETQTVQKKWEHEEFFNKFDNRAKLERLIWLVSQSKKVNMNPVFDMIWCIRYGRTGDSDELREQNPISCYQCSLKDHCKGYSIIENSKVLIHEGDFSETVRNNALDNGCDFICITSNQVPKKIERLVKSIRSKKWVYVDEFSGLRMKPVYTTTLTGIHSVQELMRDLNRNPFSSGP